MSLAVQTVPARQRFAREFLPAEGVLEFLNADLLAAGLAPLWPEAMAIRAARLLLNRWRELVAKVDFAFESTLSGRTYAGMLREAKCVGYVVKSVLSAFLTRNSLCAAYVSACLRGAYRASGGCAPNVFCPACGISLIFTCR